MKAANGGFPPAKIYASTCTTAECQRRERTSRSARRPSPWCSTHMEQTALYNAYNFSQASTNGKVSPLTATAGSAFANTTVVGVDRRVASCAPPTATPPDARSTTRSPRTTHGRMRPEAITSSAPAIYTDYNCPGPDQECRTRRPRRRVLTTTLTTTIAANA